MEGNGRGFWGLIGFNLRLAHASGATLEMSGAGERRRPAAGMTGGQCGGINRYILCLLLFR